jgi:nitrous oxidase accessory protein
VERKVILCLFFIAILFVWMPEKAESAVREVGEGKPYAQVTEALRVAESGDVIRVYPGEYRGNLVIDRSVTLEAVEIGKAKIIGTGEGNVITVRHPGVTIRGFEISSGGLNYLKNDAAIMVTRDGARIEKNRIRQSLFGIYLKKSSNHVIRENDIVGREERSFSERGNGLQIYYSHRNRVEKNRFRHVRDGIYVEFSHRNRLHSNRVEDSRYGVHYMWSDDNVFEGNVFLRNVSGAAIMFSKRVKLTNNRFENSQGLRSFGMFLQTVEDSEACDNLFLHNSIGVFSDLSRNIQIHHNTFLANDIGMEMLGSNWDSVVYQNNFIDNLQHLAVNEQTTKIDWFRGERGNYWSDYEGVDVSGKGIGEPEYQSGNLFEYLMTKYPHTRLFIQSPTAKMLEAIDRWFPVVSRPSVTDPYPLMEPVRHETYDQLRRRPEEVGGAAFALVISAALLLMGGGAFWVVHRRNR